MKYKALIFDLDGTILDTLEDLKNSVNFALSKNNLPKRTTEEIRSFVGNGIRLLVERSVPNGTPVSITDCVFADFKEHYSLNSACNTKAYDGIYDVLSQLRSKGVLLGVVSNKADFAVQILIKTYFDGMFHFATGEKQGIKRKPCPDSVYTAAKYLGVELQDCLYIGDSDVDIETARNAKISCMCVTWGFRDKEYLKRLNPDYLVDYPNQILECIGD